VDAVRRVILLDDNPDMLATLKLLLEDGGLDVVTCMPDADGLEVIQQFRRGWPAMRIIAMSGGGRKVKGDYLDTAREAGADIALRKPVDPNELLRLLSS
jgi:CheY-like chemotaxis protein